MVMLNLAAKKCILNSDFTTILQIMRFKKIVENEDRFFLIMGNQSFLVKMV